MLCSINALYFLEKITHSVCSPRILIAFLFRSNWRSPTNPHWLFFGTDIFVLSLWLIGVERCLAEGLLKEKINILSGTISPQLA